MKTKTIKQPKEAKEKVIKPTIKLISFSVKATIPTGEYANVIPEITVEAQTLEEAKAFVLPEIDKLIKLYFHCKEKEPIAGTRKVTPAPVVAPVTTQAVIDNKTASASNDNKDFLPRQTPTSTETITKIIKASKGEVVEDQSEAFKKAKMTLDGAKTPEAIELIHSRIKASSKLTEQEKIELLK